MDLHPDLKDVLTFWFEELTPKDWSAGGEELDKKIKSRFADLHTRVAGGEYWRSRTTPAAWLAEVIVLDQFSRNMFRGSAKSFAFDGQALLLAQTAIDLKFDKKLKSQEKQFLYMPFMHSESKMIHEEAVNLFESLDNEDTLKYEHLHKKIIDQFGRYPHRNQVLGRESTTAELEYLANHQESFF